jgi:EmrB/QacA subfamily drug resistance transporter
VNLVQESRRAAAAKRNLAVAGVMMVIFLFAIDATIVSTAMPTIVAKLGGLELYSWVFSIYMLTSALTTPLFGKLSDLFSRRRLMLIGIGVFVVGSTLCGAAQSMEALVVCRAIQGLGGGAIYALAFIVVGVLFPAEMRAKMQGIISSVWGIASVLGPLAGGLIVEHASWRWAFFVNLPITAVAVAFIVGGLEEQNGERRAPRLDLKGAATLLVALMLLFYALAKNAHSLQPFDLTTLGVIAVAFVALVAFCFIERRAKEPTIPLDLFQPRLFRISTAIASIAAMGVFGAVSYLPLHLQGVLGLMPSRAGMVLLLVSLGWTTGSLLGGQLMNRLGYRLVTVAGMILLALGFVLFVSGGQVGVISVLTSGAAVGVGMGLVNLTTLVAAQTAVSTDRIGVATSTVMLFRTFGGAFGVSLMGTVLLNRMELGLHRLGASQHGLSPALMREPAQPQNLLEPATRAQIPPELLPKLVGVLANSIWYAFAIALALMMIGILLSFFMSDDASKN